MGCPCALSNLGELYETIGDYGKATEYFEQALTEAVEYREFYYGNLARVARKQGNLDAALSYFDAALVEMPESPLIYLLRGQHWLALEEPAKAAADLERYVEGIAVTTETYTLRLNTVRNTQWRPSHIQRGKYNGQAGDLFTAYADPRDPADTINPLLVLLSPDGTPLTANDDIDDTSNAAMLTYRLPATGQYTLLITHGFQATPIRGSLRLLSLLETPQTEIDLGEMRVTAGAVPLNVREQPTLEGDILFTIREGQVVTLTDGPRFADGYRWWFLETESRERGWAVDTVETVRQFSPIAPN
jgi:tetratricopeptide (TPR) repeat protein